MIRVVATFVLFLLGNDLFEVIFMVLSRMFLAGGDKGSAFTLRLELPDDRHIINEMCLLIRTNILIRNECFILRGICFYGCYFV